jgi:hypothetical protein
MLSAHVLQLPAAQSTMYNLLTLMYQLRLCVGVAWHEVLPYFVYSQQCEQFFGCPHGRVMPVAKADAHCDVGRASKCAKHNATTTMQMQMVEHEKGCRSVRH